MSETVRPCEEVRRMLLEDGPSAALEEHLASCAACRELVRAHRAALALRQPEGDPGSKVVEAGQVLRVVRRRKWTRASAAASLVAASVALAVALVPTDRGGEGRAPAADFSVLELAEEVESYATWDSADDPVLSEHQTMLAWLAPPSVSPSSYELLPWQSVTPEGGTR